MRIEISKIDKQSYQSTFNANFINKKKYNARNCYEMYSYWRR